MPYRPSVWQVVLMWLLAMFAHSLCESATAALSLSCRVVRHEAYDRGGIQTYALHCGEQHGTVTLLADDDLAVATLLRKAGRVRVTVEPLGESGLQRLER